ncbi:MAG: response regulator [Candidatus Hydrothermarchaeaceae archaeon]
MIVDDEENILYFVSEILKKGGLEVITVSSGEDAIRMLKTDKPDLILLNVMMPGKDGFETCKEIKVNKENDSIIISMLTAKSSDEDRLRSLEECKADWHITKPIERKKLLDIVNWLLRSSPRLAAME